MSAPFVPKQLSEIYSEITASILAFTPITSTKLGEVADNIAFAVASELRETYQQQVNALDLLNEENLTGDALDKRASEFPNLAPRFQPTYATGQVTVTDPTITVHATVVASGGATHATTFVNSVNATGFPSTGTLLIGTRGSVSFETWPYTSIIGNQFNSSTPLVFDHGAGEPVVLHTVGDRTYSGPFTLSTQPTSQTPAKLYSSTGPLVIFDGDKSGLMNIQAQQIGLTGNTSQGTINQFIGTVPFTLASVTNGADLTNGQALESDANLRARIRLARQALSSANIDAVTSVLLNVNNNGQLVRFAQVIEDPDPTLPSIVYIDDGTGFIPTQTALTTPIVLVYSASGGEDHFRIGAQYLPIVVLTGENNTRIFTNITVKLNGGTLLQGDTAGKYRVQPDGGIIKLMTALNPGDNLQITALQYYTGLVNLANKSIYGDRADRTNFPGVSGLGAWVQVHAPTVQFISIQGTVNLDGSRPLNDVITDITQNFLNYVNNLGIGVTVVKNRLTSLAFVSGVKDFTLLTPASDVIIPSGSLAKVTAGNIILS